MKNIFLDCGTHLCEGLSQLINEGVIDGSFEIHTFEPNPACNVPHRLKEFPFDITFHEKAVWVKDGHISFNQENHKISGSGSPTDGTSDIDGWGSSVDNIGFDHPGYLNKILVESIDFSRFVNELPDDANIICKMDIEGSEFTVLRKMIREGSIKKIKKIYVEFHERIMLTEDINSKNEIVNKLKELGIEVFNWL